MIWNECDGLHVNYVKNVSWKTDPGSASNHLSAEILRSTEATVIVSPSPHRTSFRSDYRSGCDTVLTPFRFSKSTVRFRLHSLGHIQAMRSPCLKCFNWLQFKDVGTVGSIFTAAIQELFLYSEPTPLHHLSWQLIHNWCIPKHSRYNLCSRIYVLCVKHVCVFVYLPGFSVGFFFEQLDHN